MHSPGASVTGFVLVFVVQIIFGIVFAALTTYGKDLLPKSHLDVVEDHPEHVPSYARKIRSFFNRKFHKLFL